MTPIDIATLILVGLLVFAASEFTIFAVRYSRLTWGHTREGRHLMGLSAVLAAALWGTILFAFVPVPLVVAAVVQFAIYGGLAFEGWRRNHLLSVNQREVADAARRRG